MKSKNLISLTIAFTILFLSSTGVLLYFGIKPKPVTSIHVLGGLLFTGFAIFHIKNNWSSVKAYSKGKNGNKPRKELLISAALVLFILAAAAFSLPPFEQIEHAGEQLFRKGNEHRPGRDQVSFTQILTNKNLVTGLPINLSFVPDQNKIISAMVIWEEDSLQHFVQNLFVPSKWMQLPPWAKDPEKIQEVFRDHKAVPTRFSASMMNEWNKTASDSLPNYAETNPTGNFILTSSSSLHNKFYIKAEIKYLDGTEMLQSYVDTAKSNIYRLRSNNSNSAAKAILSL